MFSVCCRRREIGVGTTRPPAACAVPSSSSSSSAPTRPRNDEPAAPPCKKPAVEPAAPRNDEPVVEPAAPCNVEPTVPPAASNRGVLLKRAYPLPGSGGAFLCVSAGSVVDFEGDAIVNAANEICLGGAGVDGAITAAGGPALAKAREALPIVEGTHGIRCPVGEARLTIGGDLKSTFCIHAVGPNYNLEVHSGRPLEDCDGLLASAYKSALACAKEKQLETIGFALLSAGIFRGPRSLAAVLTVAVQAVRDAAYEGLKEVHLVAFKEEEIEALLNGCVQVLGDPPADASAAAAQSAVGWEALKTEGTKRYMANDFEGAIEKYGDAIKALEVEAGDDEPEDPATCRNLAVLCTNRAMAGLQILKKAHEGKTCVPGSTLPPDLRGLAMRAHVDASRATDLDEGNAKAWLRKGQALLWMSSMQQRSKESVKALERARDCPALPDSIRREVEQWLAVAKRAFDDQTPMPENCPQM